MLAWSKYHLEDILLLFGSMEARERVLAMGGMRTSLLWLFVKPWTRQEGAITRSVLSKVEVELVGIPGYAWEFRSTEALLADCCWLDEADFATVTHGDMSVFRCTAWSPDIACIPPANTLVVAEPDNGTHLRPPVRGHRFGDMVKTLLYPVHISAQVIESSPPPSPGRAPNAHR
jgi:hypothetical protein